jgi:asparagine synthase (glutamine-hydrolysing)
MCGIAGYAGKGDEATIRAMGQTLRHRGPDASGVWRSSDGGVGFAHARLAIIDLSPGGAQPMRSNDGHLIVAFNGEIYNFSQLKKELAAYPFKTHSDTEVILAAYQKWGTGAFARMRGMFAIALYDVQKGELVLVRDRLGKKPLYWSVFGDTLVFGSELKALLAHPVTPRTIDHRSLAHYLAREFVPTPRTIYEGIQKLSPGSVLRYTNGKVDIEPFWNPAVATSRLDEVSALERFDSLLNSATRERMVSDVPLGVFLSGGIDSSTIAYYAAQAATKKIQTFSIGFNERSFDESSSARLVAEHLQTNHHEQIISGEDVLALVQDIPLVFDEPVADASVLPTVLLSRFTREHVTVALGGDGADETLLGYPTFQAEQYAPLYARIPEGIRALLRTVIEILPTSTSYMSLDFKMRKFTHDFADNPMMRHLQWLGSFKESELENLLVPADIEKARGITEELTTQWQAECPQLEGLNALSHLYLRTYLMDQVLVKVDRASMRYGLEVRAPFLSHDVVEFLLSLPSDMKYRNGRGKYLLRELMRGRLPDQIIDRPKQGFAAPVAEWLRGPLKGLATDLLSPSRLKGQSIFNVAEVERLVREHMSGSRNHHKKLWTLLVFELWNERWNP